MRAIIPKLFAVFSVGVILMACNDAPKIQIVAVDCPADSISITDVSRAQPQAGSQCKLSSVITIMCGSNPIGSAEIVITRKGADPKKYTANGEGKVNYTENFPVECSTYNLEVEVQGSDKVQRRTITIKP